VQLFPAPKGVIIRYSQYVPLNGAFFKLAFPDLTFEHERSSQEELIRMKKILTNLEVESHLMGSISFALISTVAPVKS
jgi:hypothetical protein